MTKLKALLVGAGAVLLISGSESFAVAQSPLSIGNKRYNWTTVGSK